MNKYFLCFNRLDLYDGNIYVERTEKSAKKWEFYIEVQEAGQQRGSCLGIVKIERDK